MGNHLDPGAGDPSGLRELSNDRHLRARRLNRAGSRVTRAASMASGAAWTGRAQEAFSEKVDAALPELTELSENLQETGIVLGVYAVAVARIKDEQEILERHRARSRDERDELVLKRHAAWIDLYEPPQLFDERAARIEQIDDQLRAVDRELSELDDWWQSLVERRRRVDADCVAALGSRSIRGALSAFLPAAGESVEIAELLARLRELSAGDGTPIVGVEHSFGSAAAGEAERRGAHFATRLMLAGIGMKDGWEPRPGTTYVSAQGPTDVNRYLDGLQAGGLGYAITPRDVAGIREIDTGYSDEQWANLAVPVSPLLAGGLTLGTALDQHNRLLDADLETNGPVMQELQLILVEARH